MSENSLTSAALACLNGLGLVKSWCLRWSEFLDDEVKWDCEYWTCGKLIRKEIGDLRKAFTIKELPKVRVIINCCGLGFNDMKLFITKGQTCAMANLSPATVTRQNADGSWTFCAPRNFDGGTVTGKETSGIQNRHRGCERSC
ncbi:hypothetical protein LZ31DRAFT_177426 [Colletotrichum somersetense]|nr:hypothetical protein LZ31DRAFT_177426 [Colletotrichum somersetense]